MPVTVTEKWESRQSTEGDNASVELTYLIDGTSDDLAAKTALRDNSPVVYDGLIRQTYSIERIGETQWEGTVRYGRRQREPETGESNLQFDTGGGTQHITQSISTSGSYAAPGETAPDFQGAIGVYSDSVEGVDITVPVYHFSETHYKSAGSITQAYKMALFELTGKVNNAAFKGFSAGEVLFLGA